MIEQEGALPQLGSRSTLSIFAWFAMLAASPFASILWRELLSSEPAWWLWFQLGIPAFLFLLALFWQAIKPLRWYLLVLLIILIAEGIIFPLVRQTSFWENQLMISWARQEFANQVMSLVLAVVVLLILLGVGFSRKDVYLVKGKIDAPVEPVPAIGLRKQEPWTSLGRNFAIIISSVTFLVLLLGFRPPASALVNLLPVFPVVLAVSVMNAFNEEFPYRAALLSQLWPLLGKNQSLLLTAALFGLAHFYGTPSGIIGVLLAGFLAWFLGKSMLETGGFFWAWFIHILQDVIIFSFQAMIA